MPATRPYSPALRPSSCRMVSSAKAMLLRSAMEQAKASHSGGSSRQRSARSTAAGTRTSGGPAMSVAAGCSSACGTAAGSSVRDTPGAVPSPGTSGAPWLRKSAVRMSSIRAFMKSWKSFTRKAPVLMCFHTGRP
eukprot:1329530-Prymnesium_polylepis.1